MFIVEYFYICKYIHPNAVGVKIWVSISTFKCLVSDKKKSIQLFTISEGY